MNLTIDIESHIFNKTSKFIRLIEHIDQCIRQREITKEQRHIKTYSIIHYIEHIKRYMKDNPLIARVLFRFYNTIKNFSLQHNRFPSTIIFDNTESIISIEEKTSMDNLYKMNPSNISLPISQSTEFNNVIQRIKSTTHYIQPNNFSHQTSGLMTKTTLTAIQKAPRQRTAHDIEILEHLLNNCENLRHLPANIRSYAARSLLFLTYQSNTILTRSQLPSFLVYIIVYGQCKLLLETQQSIIYVHQLNIGDVYGDDSLDYRLNGLITNEINHCNLIGFFLRDIKAYENYLSDMMKQSLFEQLRIQSTFSAIQWGNEILNNFLKWSNYKQYSIDEIIYGNEEYEHDHLYFILHGQVSFVCLLEFPSMVIEHPELSQHYPTWNKQKNDFVQKTAVTDAPLDIDNHLLKPKFISNSHNNPECLRNKKNKFPPKNQRAKLKTTWRFLEVFILSNGHYFGFEPTTIHSWYLTQSTVDIISIPKTRFKELGYFTPMIFEKLRQDFLDIYPNEIFIRNSYIKYLQTNKFNEQELSTMKFSNEKQRSILNHHNEINWIAEQNILNEYKEKLHFSTN